ncbi:MAG: DNA methyltransferase [Acidobacteria bacterium]|nr:DNA methyltransferase [Acidobacteriota bacterium]
MPTRTTTRRTSETGRLLPNAIACGDAREHTARIPPESVDLALWSPPYLMDKPYERDLDITSWTELMRELLGLHATVLRPGGFAVVNIGDVRAWPDPALPPGPYARIRHREGSVTAAAVAARQTHPGASEREIARLLGCSEQTVARREHGSAHRAGRRPPSRVLRTSGIIEDAASAAGLYLYDHRIWSKTPAWKNNAWTASSYRAVDEWEHLLFFHRPGPFVYDRNRIDQHEWAEWGSRGIWKIPSVGRNDDNAPRFPDELAARIVRVPTQPGQLVLDPFVGTGNHHRGRAPARAALDRNRPQPRDRPSRARPHPDAAPRRRSARARRPRRRPARPLTAARSAACSLDGTRAVPPATRKE